MKKLFLLLFFLCYTSILQAQNWEQFHFQNGDLLFQDIDCGGLCDAIEAVTPGLKDKHFSHIGLVTIIGDSTFVIEAIGKNVHLTPIKKFILRQTDAANHPKIVVGRLKHQYQKLNTKAIQFAIKQEGKLYDHAFIYNNGKYYCSELIYDAYRFANKGKPFFQLFPMTFKDPKTKKTFPAWVDYYKDLKMKIPEGKPGCNPGSIAVDKKIDIITSFY